MKKYAVLLVRVSTSMQDYDPQIKDLKKYAKDLGYETHIIETKESGLLDYGDRIGTHKLFEFIKENPHYQTIICTELSRLSRRESILHTIKDWLVKHKIQLLLKDGNYKLLDENGRLTTEGGMMFTLYGMFSENEIKQKKERFQRAKASLMEMGFSIGGKTLFGYKRVDVDNKRTTLVIDKKNADYVRRIFSWYLNGINEFIRNPSIRQIALECEKGGYPYYTTRKRNVNKLLKEEAYLGFKITNNKRKNHLYKDDDSISEKYIITQNKIKYPQIIDNETFELVQKKLLENNTNVEKSNKHITLLAKLIQCKECNCYLNADYRKVGNHIKNNYRCSSRASANPCSNKQSISMALLDSAIWSLIKIDLPAMAQTIRNHNPNEEINELNNQILNLENRKNDIDSEVENELKLLNTFKQNKKLNLEKYINDTIKKVKKLNKEAEMIENEKNSIHFRLMNLNGEERDYFSIINNNLPNIENNKTLLKEFINVFIKKISILEQNRQYTIAVLELKFFTYSRNEKDEVLDKYVTIIIDKTITNSIQLYKATKFFRSCNNAVLNPSSIRRILNGTSLDSPFEKIQFSKLQIY